MNERKSSSMSHGRRRLRIGLISDTHMPERWPALPPALWRIFEGVDLILHAGDVGELWVLDQLASIAPVIAVHGNDETDEATRELPYQQLLFLGGTRILLCHSHLPDRAAELASRVPDDWRPKLEQRRQQAERAGASIYILGHLHIPFARQVGDVLLVNPGAIACGYPFTRQTRQTVALLDLAPDSRATVTFFDLAEPGRPYLPDIDWSAGFAAALATFSDSVLEASAQSLPSLVRGSDFAHDRRFWRLVSRAAMPCWVDGRRMLSVADLDALLGVDPTFSDNEKAMLRNLFSQASIRAGRDAVA